jgi:hypothetical protein
MSTGCRRHYVPERGECGRHTDKKSVLDGENHGDGENSRAASAIRSPRDSGVLRKFRSRRNFGKGHASALAQWKEAVEAAGLEWKGPPTKPESVEK